MTKWFGFLAAVAFLYFVFVLPDWPGNLVSYTFMRLPIELVMLVLGMALIPLRYAKIARLCVVAVLSIVSTLKIANLVTFEGYSRPFNILVDPALIPVALQTIVAGQGMITAVGAAFVGVGIILLTIFLLWHAVGALTKDRSPITMRTTGITTSVALIAAIPLADVKIGESWWYVTSWDTARFAHERARSVVEGLEYDAAFREELDVAGYGDIPADKIFADLQGADVLLIFVEAYGRAALDDATIAQSVRPALEAFDNTLREKGYAARSAWMTSPTFGGQSWLAHGSFVTGLWVDNQRRYESLFVSERDTLMHDFSRGGWRTVGVMPQITLEWPEGEFFGYDKIYAAADLEYAGPRFDYMTMPDQYTLSVLHRRELAPLERPPVMAEVALISSHLPWTPMPKVVPWDDIKTGEVFFEERHPRGPINWTDAALMRSHFTDAMIYELQTLESFVGELANDNTLLIIMGDHQPIPIVSGESAPYDVPIHVIATNPALLEEIEAWSWTPGMVPDDQSPVWRMDVMRRHLLESFTPGAPQSTVPVIP